MLDREQKDRLEVLVEREDVISVYHCKQNIGFGTHEDVRVHLRDDVSATGAIKAIQQITGALLTTSDDIEEDDHILHILRLKADATEFVIFETETKAVVLSERD